MRHTDKLFKLLALILLMTLYTDAGITGNWVTYDDKSGKKKSIVKITQRGNTLSGKIIKMFTYPPDTVCTPCKGKLHNKKVLGMTIFSNLTLKDGKWKGGKILDPENGKWYTCEMWEEGSKLKVRGYILMFFRTQIWKRH